MRKKEKEGEREREKERLEEKTNGGGREKGGERVSVDNHTSDV